MFEIVVICMLGLIFFLVFPPSNRKRVYMTQLEKQEQNWRVNEQALTSECRLLKSEVARLTAKVEGMGVERELLEREVEEYKALAIERKNLLIARGYEKG